jgi:hypothetical protein
METEPPKAEPPRRKRRWFQFSLRTLLIGVTLLAVACAYVAWQARIVRERRALLLLIESREYGWYSGERSASHDFPPAASGHDLAASGHNLTAGKTEDRPAWIRHWLGDETVYLIWLRNTVPSSEAVLIENCFPEAVVWQDN